MEEEEKRQVAEKLRLRNVEVCLLEIPPKNLKLLPDNFQVLVYDALTEKFRLKMAKSFKAGYDKYLHYLIFDFPRLKDLKV